MRDIFGLSGGALIALLSQLFTPHSAAWSAGVTIGAIAFVLSGAHLLWTRGRAVWRRNWRTAAPQNYQRPPSAAEPAIALKCSFDPKDPFCKRPDTTTTLIPPTPSTVAATGHSSSSTMNIWSFNRPEIATHTYTAVPTASAFFSGFDDALKRDKPPTAPPSRKGTYYRLKVEAVGGFNVSGCRGRFVLGVRPSGKNLVEGENVTLPFAPAEDADAVNKTVHVGHAEYIDFLCVPDDDAPYITAYENKGSSSINWGSLFNEIGDYRFTIAALSPNSTASAQVIFRWTGNHKTAEVLPC